MTRERSTTHAVIAVIEKARGRSDARPSSRLLSVALMAVFFVALMGGLAAGALMYRSVVEAQTLANELHLQAGLIANVIRSNDFAGAVSEGEGPEGPAIVLERQTSRGTYETRIYHYQGNVMQEFAVAGRPFDPLGATTLLASDEFSFTIGDGLVTFTTDDGTFSVALRADPEAAATDEGGVS